MKYQNEFLKSAKHVFLHDYFLHMWLVLRARNFETNEYKQLVKWFKKEIISLENLCFKISKFWKFYMI
jgi:hypothetical protein